LGTYFMAAEWKSRLWTLQLCESNFVAEYIR
jgi:hypothetical protein